MCASIFNRLGIFVTRVSDLQLGNGCRVDFDGTVFRRKSFEKLTFGGHIQTWPETVEKEPHQQLLSFDV